DGRKADGLSEVTLSGARWAQEESVFSAIDELACGELEDEAAVHLLVEVEIECIEGLVGLAKLSVLDAAPEQPIATDGELVGDECGEEVDRSHLAALSFEDPRLESERRGAGIIDGRSPVLSREREHAEDSAYAVLLLPGVDLLGETSNVLARALGTQEQSLRAARHPRRPIFVLGAVVARPMPQVFAQQDSALRIEDPHLEVIPLHPDQSADVPGRYGVVGAGDFDVPIEVHGAIAVLVETKRLDGQRSEEWLLLRKHRRDLALGGAVNASVGPVCLPAIE